MQPFALSRTDKRASKNCFTFSAWLDLVLILEIQLIPEVDVTRTIAIIATAIKASIKLNPFWFIFPLVKLNSSNKDVARVFGDQDKLKLVHWLLEILDYHLYWIINLCISSVNANSWSSVP